VFQAELNHLVINGNQRFDEVAERRLEHDEVVSTADAFKNEV
jgi:hypothetical protein